MKKIGLLLFIILLLSTTSFAYEYQECDRECLVNLMKNYLSALAGRRMRRWLTTETRAATATAPAIIAMITE